MSLDRKLEMGLTDMSKGDILHLIRGLFLGADIEIIDDEYQCRRRVIDYDDVLKRIEDAIKEADDDL